MLFWTACPQRVGQDSKSGQRSYYVWRFARKREPQQTAADDIESRAKCIEAICPRGLRAHCQLCPDM